uniref:Uncharacterized protein n=1 Tax=Myripristis murdjan TaxID=586833 RepID=A0A668A632_9TELE
MGHGRNPPAACFGFPCACLCACNHMSLFLIALLLYYMAYSHKLDLRPQSCVAWDLACRIIRTTRIGLVLFAWKPKSVMRMGGGSQIAVNIIDHLTGWLPVGSVGGGETPPSLQSVS